MKHCLSLACVALLATIASADQGNPKLKSIEAIRFGPNGMLIIGGGSDVVTVETGDTKEITWTKTDIDSFDQNIAGKLGLMPKDIEIRRIAVNPASKKLYVAVRSLKANQYVILTVDGDGKVDEFSLENVKYQKYPLQVGVKAVTKITDVVFAGGRIVAATQASDQFASRVFTIVPGKAASQFYTETFHTGHNAVETKAPILCLMAYEDGPKTNVVGSFTCTPIVKYPIDDVEPNVKVKGTTVMELGKGNQPLSMFAYEKDGKKFILVNVLRKFPIGGEVGPSKNWVAKVDHELLKETVNVDAKALWRVDPKGKASVSVTDRATVATTFHGVQHMDRLDTSRAIVVRTVGKAQNLSVLALP
ncbi:MAG: hypothetical protein FJ303_22255 [Planctomycetes bacterium]|nr:hypothetical protein [Planctomycetota bacterium]